MNQLSMTALDGRFAVCRLAADAPMPAWPRGAFVSITRTTDELSIVCEDGSVPPDVRADRGWRCMKVEGPIPFEVTGVAAAITKPLADHGISVFLVATFDTDYVLVKEETLEAAAAALSSAGIDVR